jgi:glyoxylate reductase
MSLILVEDDKILRFVQCLLDPDVVPERMDAFIDFLSFDTPDVNGWIKNVQNLCGDLYPSTVHMVNGQDALRSELPNADGLVLESLFFGNEELRKAPKLRVVQNFGLDTRNIDLEACEKAGVKTPRFRRRVNSAVGEHAIALMLAVGRKICETNGALDFESLKKLGYDAKLYNTEHISGANWARISGLKNLQGSTLGALGLGEVGREVASKAKGMGMDILYNQRRQLPPDVEKIWDAKYVSFEELFERSDFISIHVPLNNETRGLVNSKAFSHMKDGAVLVNVSRAHIIEREALIQALDSGRLGGAAFDVHYAEPASIDEPLKAYPNVVLSPHIAVGPRSEALLDMAEIVTNLAEAIKENKNL